MNKAEQSARRDIASHVPAYYPDSNTWDQYNTTASHVFTKENRKLNKLLRYEN